MTIRQRARSDEGETLIELLITIIVLSIGAVAVVAAMTGTVLASDAHRSLASGEVALRDYTEAVVQQGARIKGAQFTPCPTAADLEPTDVGALPPGWTGSIEAIEYWIPDTDDGHWGSVGDCTVRNDNLCGGAPSAAIAPSCAPGLVKLTLHVNNPNLTQVSTKDMRGTVLVRRSNSS